jgi:hypothetical protein
VRSSSGGVAPQAILVDPIADAHGRTRQAGRTRVPRA